MKLFIFKSSGQTKYQIIVTNLFIGIVLVYYYDICRHLFVEVAGGFFNVSTLNLQYSSTKFLFRKKNVDVIRKVSNILILSV